MFNSMGQPDLLSAVNSILRAYGSAEVSRLKESKEATFAEKIILEELVSCLSTGYEFCTVRDVKLDQDVNGYIPLPADCISVKPWPQFAHLKATKRGNRLYSLALNSFEMPYAIRADIVLYIPFEELPIEVVPAVVLRACFAFISDRKPDDPSLRGVSKRLELANAALETYDRSISDGRPSFQQKWRR